MKAYIIIHGHKTPQELMDTVSRQIYVSEKEGFTWKPIGRAFYSETSGWCQTLASDDYE